MVLGGGWVGQLLPQVVLGHFAASDAVQEGLRFRTFQDLSLADVVYRGGRVVHLVQVQHFVEELVLLLLMLMEHVDRRMALVVWRSLLLGREMWRRSLLLLLVFGDLRE